MNAVSGGSGPSTSKRCPTCPGPSCSTSCSASTASWAADSSNFSAEVSAGAYPSRPAPDDARCGSSARWPPGHERSVRPVLVSRREGSSRSQDGPVAGRLITKPHSVEITGNTRGKHGSRSRTPPAWLTRLPWRGEQRTGAWHGRRVDRIDKVVPQSAKRAQTPGNHPAQFSRRSPRRCSSACRSGSSLAWSTACRA